MPRPRTPAVSIRMYRHFAVATLVITASLALFVDQENGRDTAHATAKPASDHADKAKPAKASNFKDARTTHGYSGGYDGGGFDGGGGTFSDTGYAYARTAADTVASHLPDAGAFTLPDVAPPGIPPDVFERMKQAQKRNGASQSRPTEEQLRALTAASLARSGSDGSEIE